MYILWIWDPLVKRQRKLGQIPVGEQAGSQGCPTVQQVPCDCDPFLCAPGVPSTAQEPLSLSSVLRPSAHSLGDRPTLTPGRQQQINGSQIEHSCSLTDTNVTQAQSVLLQLRWLPRAEGERAECQLLSCLGDSHERAGP